MFDRGRKSMVVATLLLAALSSYVDLPRIHAALNLGDTLNVARVIDPVHHTRMLQKLTQLDGDVASELRQDLDEGMQSLDLLGSTSVLQAIVAPSVQLPSLVLEDTTPGQPGNDAGIDLLTGISGSLLTLDLPPPRFETLFQPPRLDAPTHSLFNNTARAPPMTLR
ncbi:MAG: hypothetical protein R3E76_17105 [Planctomycetota bacterium]